LEHNEKGKVDYSPQNHKNMTRKCFKKLSYMSETLEKNPKEYFGSYKAKIGIIGWGSTMGAIREARYLDVQIGTRARHQISDNVKVNKQYFHDQIYKFSSHFQNRFDD
jgi:hypothetical protein